MGSDKAIIEVDGTPMALRVAGALRDGGCDPVIAVGGDGGALGALGMEVVPDSRPGEGPLAAIATALDHLDADAVVVAACDLAALDAATVASLVTRWSTAKDEGRHVDVVVAVTDRDQPLCAVWDRCCSAALASRLAGGGRAVHEALAELVVERVVVDGAALENVNTPADLRHVAGDGQEDPDR